MIGWLAEKLNLPIRAAEIHVSATKQRSVLIARTYFGIRVVEARQDGDDYSPSKIAELANGLRGRGLEPVIVNCDEVGCADRG